MIHVYAVTDATVEADLGVSGLAGAPVEFVAVAGLAVVITRHDSAAIPPSTEAILAHARVCDAVQHAGLAGLPVRFGARYADDTTLRRAVEEHAEAFVAALDHVRGRVEIGVRVAGTQDSGAADDAPPPPPPPSGAAYLQQRRLEESQRTASRAHAQAIADEIHEFLRGCAVDATLKVQATPGLVLSAAYLVATDDVATFTDRVAELSRRRSDLQLLCTGPWPPYHFAGQGALT